MKLVTFHEKTSSQHGVVCIGRIVLSGGRLRAEPAKPHYGDMLRQIMRRPILVTHRDMARWRYLCPRCEPGPWLANLCREFHGSYFFASRVHEVRRRRRRTRTT